MKKFENGLTIYNKGCEPTFDDIVSVIYDTIKTLQQKNNSTMMEITIKNIVDDENEVCGRLTFNGNIVK